ncbi:DnaD domain protein [Agathobacter rectalis]|uniref:DnaD domain protein n=1 Tax=Agathobacter rectalis TaxID=39491 RepID=A0AAW4WHK6_9FIRM|nr:DnaD domain protein [Agathobacter rectalis]MCC2746146.1 DnaD domain protein [Agathobacter rectalis]NSI36183.1 DnaD domain protein [Agathobacter rectalis]NSI39456.1 DnaD domain protein [Agathobacter rectalis]NSI68936.1 DnaD domain protein [Agathobacter rectalis]NSI74791.1 DnaD domain protein [Agathobacter rectalis]
MTAINISSDIATSFTTVSDIFIDQYMPKANGEFVKVYLYLLRATGSGAGIATISEIADHFSNTEADIIRALNYWVSEGILQVQTGADGQIIGINLCSLSVSGMQAAQSNIQSAVADNAAQNNLQNGVVNNATQNNLQNGVVNNAAQNISTANIRMQDSVVEKLKNQATDKPAPSQKEYTLDEIKEFRKNPDISELFFIIETYLKHTLSSTDTNMVLYWLDELHFSTDLVEYLVEYCITKGHSSLRYMNKVALGWADAGIKTVDQAKDDAAAHSQIYYSVMKALGITGRNLVDSEVSLINKWVGEYGFDIELVKAACSKTISAIQKPSFEYTDSILANWKKKDVHTLKDVEVLDANFAKANKASATGSSQGTNAANGSSKPKNNNSSSKNKFNNFNQRNNDYDKLEKLFLNSTV